MENGKSGKCKVCVPGLPELLGGLTAFRVYSDAKGREIDEVQFPTVVLERAMW
jgi:hypothetical protein